MSKHPTTLALLNQHPGVDSAYRDVDGVWIELRRGWATPGGRPFGRIRRDLYDEPRGIHGLYASTVRDAVRQLRDVAPCGCPDCVGPIYDC